MKLTYESRQNLSDKSFLVFGAGISGQGSAELLTGIGVKTYLYDANESLDKEKIYSNIPESENFKILLGQLDDIIIDEIDITVLSPGVPVDNPDVERLRRAGSAIWGEVELAWQFEKGRVLAVTGTNGKTTTTSLLGEILKKYNKNTFIAGNIGYAYTKSVLETDENSLTVLEISSFQLETTDSFHPHVSAILNFSDDHLDRHHTYENYIGAKKRIIEKQDKNDYCVLNYEDDDVRSFGMDIKNTNVMFFSSRRRIENGFYLDFDSIVYNDGKEDKLIVKTQDLNLLGLHNYENVMAAAAMALCVGVPIEIIKSAAKSFRPIPHRIEFCGEKNGVCFFNDSKATNPDAAIKGIEAMNHPTILIGGGYNKDSEYDEWIESFNGKVRNLILLGDTKEKIAECARKHNFEDITFAESLEDAVSKSVEMARNGDAVLLSPACASWDMFKSYEERGDKFRELVKNIN